MCWLKYIIESEKIYRKIVLNFDTFLKKRPKKVNNHLLESILGIFERNMHNFLTYNLPLYSISYGLITLVKILHHQSPNIKCWVSILNKHRCVRFKLLTDVYLIYIRWSTALNFCDTNYLCGYDWRQKWRSPTFLYEKQH